MGTMPRNGNLGTKLVKRIVSVRLGQQNKLNHNTLLLKTFTSGPSHIFLGRS